MVPLLFVFSCIVDLVPAIPMDDINETNFRVSEVISIDSAPNISVNYSAGTIFLGVITNVLGITMGSDANNVLVFGWWVQYLLTKAAVAAFLNRSVVTDGAPTTLYPVDYHILFGDEANYKLDAYPPLSSASHTIGIAHRMLRGNDLGGQSFPPVSTLVASYSYTTEAAMLASAYGVPTVGFYSSKAEFDDKSNYPWFMRTMETTRYTAGAVFASHLNYTRADELACEFIGHTPVSAELKRIYQEYGISVFSATFAMGEHTGWPPGYPPMSDPSLPIHTDLAMKAEWDYAVNLLKKNNAHLHLSYMGGECPVLDILSYLALNGLMGAGHLWTCNSLFELFDDQYIAALRVIGPPTHGVVSPYAFVKPYDGAVAIRIKADPARTRLHAWLKWLDDNGYRTKLVPEDYLQPHLTSSVFQSPTDQQWRGGLDGPYYLFDAVYTALSAINHCLLTIGTGFTNEQLFAAMKNVKFGGTTGKIAFDQVTGNRLAELELFQYRVLSRGNHTYSNVPYRRLTDDNYKELKEIHSRRLEESRRMSTCALPGNTPTAIAAYMDCLALVCEDADSSVVNALSGGKVPNCEAAYAAVSGACDLDLSTILTTLTTGTYLWKVCPGKCKSECADRRCLLTASMEVDTCTTPAGTTPADLMPYMGCLSTYTMDASNTLLSAMTGGAVTSCASLHGLVEAQKGDCTFDLSALTSVVPANTPLNALCPATCSAPTCAVPSQSTPTTLVPYITCLVTNCLDADATLVSALTGGAIASCTAAAAAFDCSLDINSMLPSLPVGTFLWKLCGVQCKTMCETEKNKCPVPADPTNQTSLGAYFACIESKCSNADDTLVNTLTGGTIADCATTAGFVGSQPGGDCNTDLKQFLPSLPTGTSLWKLCGGECKTECEAAKATTSSCAVPTSLNFAALASYFKCIRGPCQDSAPSLISKLTGTNLADCTAAYNYATSLGQTCKLELNSLAPSFPPGIRLWQVCPGVCYHECAAEPAANRTLDFYMQCRKTYCADTPPIIISNLTGGNVVDCPALKTLAKDDCTYDVSKTMPRLGKVTPLWSMCSASCDCTDGSGPAPAPPPPPTCPKDASACDFYSTGNYPVFAEYVTSLTMIAPLLFYDLSPTIPPDLNLPCQHGQRYNVRDGTCENCPPGQYTNKLGQTACSQCPTGTANPASGVGQCAPCPWGTFSDQLASTTCKNCTAGKFTGEPLQSQCLLCNPGEFSLIGATHCPICEAGSYQSLPGQSFCHMCDDLIPGSTSIRASVSNLTCLCPSETYWRPSVGCANCVEGLQCNGMGMTAIQVKGYHAHIFDAPTRGYEVYECSVPEWCPGGLPGTCEANRDGPSCARLYGDGCQWFFLFGIPIMGLVVCFGVYKVTAHSQYGAVTQVMILSGNVSIALVAMQAVNVYMSFFTAVPDELKWVTDFTQIFMLQFNMVLPQCNMGQSFLARYAMGIVPPVAVIAGFLILLVATNLLGKVTSLQAFNLNGTINCIGMILQVLYVMQCKDAFAFFNTISNPSGQETLKNFTDVVLWSDIHLTPMTILVTCYLFIFYVIGTYALFVWVVINARTKVKNKTFIARFRFVLSRWRPDCWHWGLWMLGRNFLIAITPVVARTDMAFQVVMYVVLLMGHALLEARYLPWAAMVNTYFEILISTILSLMAAGGLIFDDDKNATPEENAMGMLMASMFVLVWIIVIFSILWTLRWGSYDARQRRRDNRYEVGCDFISGCGQIANKLEAGNPGVQRAWKSFIQNSGDFDRIVLSSSYKYITRFSDPDPLRRASFVSTITSYTELVTFWESENDQTRNSNDEVVGKEQLEWIEKRTSLSSDDAKSVLEGLGFERHGRLKVEESNQCKEVDMMDRQDSDATVNI